MSFLPCPCCGMLIDETDPDVIHKSATFWRDTEKGFRKYLHRSQAIETDNQCWELHCNTIYGGCGLSLDADTYDELKTKWNKRTVIS